MIYEEIYFSCYILLSDQIWLPLLPEMLRNMCIVNVREPVGDVINFETNFIFLMKLFFLHDQKNVKQKCKYQRLPKSISRLNSLIVVYSCGFTIFFRVVTPEAATRFWKNWLYLDLY